MASIAYQSESQTADSLLYGLNDIDSDEVSLRTFPANDNTQTKFILKMNNDNSYLIAAHRSHAPTGRIHHTDHILRIIRVPEQAAILSPQLHQHTVALPRRYMF